MKPRKPVTDPVLKEWLTEFKKLTTRRSYLSSMRKFKEHLQIEDLGKYLKSSPDATGDIRRFLTTLDGRPSKSIMTYVTAVKVFFQDHNVEVDDNGWRKLRRRGFIPKRVRAETRDKIPTKKLLKKILNYADLKARSQTLFLVSSGARIGETLQLEEDDFDFNADPPRVHIRAEITKGGIGERITYFSYEARDAIKDWLGIKGSIQKRSGGSYAGSRVFNWSSFTARFMWNLACDKAGCGDRDKRTGRRIYHLHTLRKFFRTKIGLDLDVTHALMGHAEYLDESYLRQEQGEIAQSYLGAMANVSVYQIEELEVSKAVEPLKAELEYLKKRNNQILKDNGDLKKKYDRLESMYEATAILCKQFDRKELEKTIKEIYQTVKAEA